MNYEQANSGIPYDSFRWETALASARNAAQAHGRWMSASSLDRALRPGRDHFFDDRVVASVPPSGASRPTAARLREKWGSACWPPITRSSSAIRASACFNSPEGCAALPPSRLPPTFAIEAGNAHRPVGVAPFGEQLALDPQILSHRCDPLAGVKPQDDLLIERVRKDSFPVPTWLLLASHVTFFARVSTLEATPGQFFSFICLECVIT